jgi:four helix bundle protein
VRFPCAAILLRVARVGVKRIRLGFYEISYGSLIELLNQLILSNDLGYLSNSDLTDARLMIDSVGRMLNALYISALTQR